MELLFLGERHPGLSELWSAKSLNSCKGRRLNLNLLNSIWLWTTKSRFWGPGPLPLDSDRIFEQVPGIQTPRYPFRCHVIHVFANFAFESLPVERSHILVLSAWWFFLLLCEDPTLQALKMDQTHCSFALASHNKRV